VNESIFTLRTPASALGTLITRSAVPVTGVFTIWKRSTSADSPLGRRALSASTYTRSHSPPTTPAPPRASSARGRARPASRHSFSSSRLAILPVYIRAALMETYVEARRAAAGRTFSVAAPAGDSGVAVLAVRKNTAAALADADGDYTPLQTDNTGALRIAGSISTSSAGPYASDAAFSSGHTGMPAFAVRKDAAAALVNADGDYTPLQTDNAGALRITGSVSTAGPYVSDAAYAGTHTGMPAFAVRKDAAAALVNADGDYTPLQTDNAGALRITGFVNAISGYGSDITYEYGHNGMPAFAVRKDVPAALTGDGDYTPLQTDSTGLLRVAAAGPYVSDTAHAGTHTGMPAFAVRNDTPGTLVGDDGDYTPLQTDSTGLLRVTAAGPYVSGETYAGTHTGMPAFAVRNDTPGVLVGDNGDYTPLQTDATGLLRVAAAGPYVSGATYAGTHTGMPAFAVRNDTPGTLVGDDGDYTPLQTDSAGLLRVTGPYVSDAAYAGTHTGMPAFAVRKDAAASLVGSDGDYTPLQTDNTGALRITGYVSTAGPYVSDDAFSGGHTGMPAFAVRKDVPAALTDNGDYTPLQTDSAGALRVAATTAADASALNASVALSAVATNVRPVDFGLMVQRGLFTGISAVHVFGNGVNSGTVGGAVWTLGGEYLLPAAASTLSIVGTSPSDAFAGTGARTVLIEGLNAAYAAVSETVSLNATTPVVSSNSYIAVNRASVSTAGSAGTTAGVISIQLSSSSYTLATFTGTTNRSENAVYTVPAGSTAYVSAVHAGGFGATDGAICIVGLCVRPFGGVFRSVSALALVGGVQNNLQKNFPAPLVVAEKSVILLKVNSVTGNWTLTGGFDLFLVTNS